MVSFPRSTLSPGSGVVLCHAASMAALLLAATTFLLRPVPASAQGVTGQETNGTSSGSRRGLQVQNVRCWCGDKESKELDIQRIGDKACGKLSLDPGSGAKGNRQGRNLVVKARRKMLTLKISPTVMGRHQRKARSSGFYLKFSRRKNEQKREKGKHRACYKVSIRGKAERKKCRNQKLQCAAVLHKRPRFLTSAIFTRSGRRHKLVGVDRVNRRKQQRTGSDESGQSKRRRRSHAHGERRMRNIQSTSPASTSTCHPQGYKNCGEWRPNIVAVSRGSDVEVRYSPRNCFATEIELTIQRGYVIVSKQTLSPDKFELTFRNIRPGDYKAAVRPMGPKCSGVSDIFKPFVVKDDSPQTTSGGMVSDGFNEVTTPTRDSCYHWHTSVELKQTSDGPNVLEVRYKTSNLTGASRVEVALEMSDYRIMDHKMIEPDQEKVRFTVNKAGEYKAYVKPHGCRDCTDFKRYGDNCDAAYITSNVVSVDVNSLRTMSTSQTQTSWMDDDATSTTSMIPVTAPQTPMTTDENHMHWLAIPAIAIIVVVSVAGVARCKGARCKERPRDPEADMPEICETVPLQHLPAENDRHQDEQANWPENDENVPLQLRPAENDRHQEEELPSDTFLKEVARPLDCSRDDNEAPVARPNSICVRHLGRAETCITCMLSKYQNNMRWSSGRDLEDFGRCDTHENPSDFETIHALETLSRGSSSEEYNQFPVQTCTQTSDTESDNLSCVASRVEQQFSWHETDFTNGPTNNSLHTFLPPRNIFLVHVTETDGNHTDHLEILNGLCDLLALLPNIQVIMDRRCLQENCRDVLAWAGRIIEDVRVVVVFVVSASFLPTCRSYKKSRSLQTRAPNAYFDIPDFAMSRMAAEGFRRAVFVTYDQLEQARQDLQGLVALYEEPPPPYSPSSDSANPNCLVSSPPRDLPPPYSTLNLSAQTLCANTFSDSCQRSSGRADQCAASALAHGESNDFNGQSLSDSGEAADRNTQRASRSMSPVFLSCPPAVLQNPPPEPVSPVGHGPVCFRARRPVEVLSLREQLRDLLRLFCSCDEKVQRAMLSKEANHLKNVLDRTDARFLFEDAECEVKVVVDENMTLGARPAREPVQHSCHSSTTQLNDAENDDSSVCISDAELKDLPPS